MSRDVEITDKTEQDVQQPQKGFFEPMPAPSPIDPSAWGSVLDAAMGVAEFPSQDNSEFVASASKLASIILTNFPHDAGSSDEAAMHTVGRIMMRLCGIAKPAE